MTKSESPGYVAQVAGTDRLSEAAFRQAVTQGGAPMGTFGECAVFSFHATQFFNTFEGGAVVTDNEDLAAKMRLMKNFGFSGYDNVIYPGTNGKMTEMAAAMGLVNLDAIDEFVAVNRRNHAVYARRLNALEGLSVLAYRLVRCYPNIPGHGDSPQRYAVRTLH